MGGSVTSQKPKMPGAMSTCCIPVSGTTTGTCKWPKVPSAEIPLCARHIVLAAFAHKEIGGAYLKSIIVKEGL